MGCGERANVLKGEVSDISDGSEDDLALGEVEKRRKLIYTLL